MDVAQLNLYQASSLYMGTWLEVEARINSLALCGHCHLRCPVAPIGSFKWELSLASFGCLTKLVHTTPHYYLKYEIYSLHNMFYGYLNCHVIFPLLITI